MTDIRRLTDSFFSHAEPANGKVYRDEPIIMTAAQRENLLPSKYRGMRMLARNLYNASAARVFYTQARFMADFEDDFAYEGEFSRYYPTYQTMSNLQLRGYFTWRTKVRRGLIEPAPLAFVFVYIYELLNGIGVGSPLEGFHTLQNFWRIYREIGAEIDGYVRLWLGDYAVYHNLDKALLADFADTATGGALLTLQDYAASEPAAVFAALNGLSSYDLARSRFFEQHAEAVQNVVYAVFAALADYYAQHRSQSLCESLFGKVYASAYYMFRGAVFYQLAKPRDAVYEISAVYKYRCQNGSWTCERFFGYRAKNREVGALLKTIDYLMRRQYGFKSALKPGNTDKLVFDIVMREIGRYQEAQQQALAPKIEIDVTQLAQIRRTALMTQSKLLVDAETEPEAPPMPVIPDALVNDTVLDDAEYGFMQCLLYGRSYAELLRVGGLMASVLADAVNTKLFDLFDDTVLADGDAGPAVLEDYLVELKGMIKP